jgi:hypothetical protein
MNPLEFLAVVLPSPGHGAYCAAELTKKKEHLFVENLEDIYPKVDTWVEQKTDAYFALATFDDKGKRKAENALYVIGNEITHHQRDKNIDALYEAEVGAEALLAITQELQKRAKNEF